MKPYEKVLKALANHRRLEIVKFIKYKNQVAVGVISSHIKLSFKSTSKHLLILYAAGILEKNQSNLSVFYSISPVLPKISKAIVDML